MLKLVKWNGLELFCDNRQKNNKGRFKRVTSMRSGY